MEKVTNFFKSFPESNICFQTSDGFLFPKKTDADAHSFSLTDKKVTEHKRSADAVESNVQTQLNDLVKSDAENAAINDAKTTEHLQSVAAGLVQNEASKEVSKAAQEVVKAAIDIVKENVATGTGDNTNQANLNAAAVIANAAADAGADKVKTKVVKPAVKKAK